LYPSARRNLKSAGAICFSPFEIARLNCWGVVFAKADITLIRGIPLININAPMAGAVNLLAIRSGGDIRIDGGKNSWLKSLRAR
jgi:hypothetical protein